MSSIIKRNGAEVPFDPNKIITAISKANEATDAIDRISDIQIAKISELIDENVSQLQHATNVEDVQDMVEEELYKCAPFHLTKNYILYRYKHMQNREVSTLESTVLSMINNANEEIKQENSNKDSRILSTQRDYAAGEISKLIADHFIFSSDVIELHNKGIIHIHDRDYRGFKSTNCCLVNLDDMLQNGTVITDTMIEKPHLFSTACNIATQIMAQVASGQYGGSTYNMYHLAKFVDVSRQKFIKDTREYLEAAGIEATEEQIRTIAEKMTIEDVKKGIQTLQYQILTLMTTNG